LWSKPRWRRAPCSRTRSRSRPRSGAIAPKEQRWGPRTLDIDIIAYDDIEIDEPGLTLPHPRLFERALCAGATCRDRAGPQDQGHPDRRRAGTARTERVEKLPARGDA